ncbi:HVA1 family protein [Actinomadura sp. HBU206391]|nr:HVA1 family protein [Actinomadura sp. HBU206391]
MAKVLRGAGYGSRPVGDLSGVSVGSRIAPLVIAASPDEPQYEARSDKSGKRAVHKPGALKWRSRSVPTVRHDARHGGTVAAFQRRGRGRVEAPTGPGRGRGSVRDGTACGVAGRSGAA